MKYTLILCALSLLVGQLAAKPFDLQGYIDEQLGSGVTEIVIAPGRYEVTPVDGVHLLFRDIEGVTIEATGVEIVCTETTQAIGIQNCRNLTIRGLTIDYDPLPFTQGVIESISADRKSHIVRISEDFPNAHSISWVKHEIYRPSGSLLYGNHYQFSGRVLADDLFEVFDLASHKDGGEQVGDVVVVASSHLVGEFRPHAILLEHSEDTVLEEVTLYSSPMFGFLEVHCRQSTYLRCVVDRRPGRMRSLNADAFHSKFATIGPRIEACKAMWQSDDGVNICGSYHLVTKCDGDSIRVIAKRGLDIQVGDTLEVVHLDGQRMADVKVVSIETTSAMSSQEVAMVKRLPFNARIHKMLNDAYRIQTEPALDVPFGSVVGAANRKGNGFSVVDCTFGNNRSRGLLIKASHGEIRGNYLENNHMAAIKVAPEYHWLESGYSRDLKIFDNTVINSGQEALLIKPVGKGSGFSEIHLKNNNFITDHKPAISLPVEGVHSLNNN